MKKLFLMVGIALLLFSLLSSICFANPLQASAYSMRNMNSPATNPYCQLYLQAMARQLHISVAELEQKKLAAEEEVLAQLVKDGKLTQKQAEIIRAQMAANAANQVCD